MKTKNNKLTRDNGQKQAELVMQTSLELLPLIMNNIPQAVFWKDRDLVYLGCNQAFADDAGFSTPEEIVGKTDFDMPWTDQAELYRADDRLVMESGEPKLNYEEPQTTPNGSTIWLNTSKIPVQENGQVVAVLAMYEDITTRKQAEADLLLRDRALASSLNAVIIVNISDNKPIYVNDALLKMTGYTREEVMQIGLSEITSNAEEPKKIRTAIQTQGFFVGEELLKRKDGSVFPANFFSSLIIGAEGRPVAVQTSFFDITERKQAEEALRESEDRFRRFTEATNEGLVFHEQGRIIDANTAAFAMFGLSDNTEFVGRNLLEFVVPESHKLVLQQMQLETVLPYEIQCVRNDGSFFSVETSTRTYKVGDRTIRASSIRDITERKQTEKVLQQSEANLISALRVAQMGHWEFDIATQMFILNDQYYSLHGLTAQEVGGYQVSVQRFAQEFVYPEDAAIVGQASQQAIETTDPHFQVQIEARILRKDGEVRWANVWFGIEKDEHGRTIKLHGVSQDITERKKAEAELRLKDGAIAASANAIVIANLDGTFAYVNDAFCKIWRCTREQALQLTANTISVSPEETKRVLDALQAQGYFIGEGSAKHFDGSLFPVDMSTSLVTDENGQPIAMVGTYIDITERKRLEREIQQAFERRGYQVQVSTEISQEVAAASELNELFNRVVTLTKERLGYYHTQLLRYDATQDAVVLISGYGETGQKMLAGGHQMPMGEGLIGTAAASGETVLRPVLADDPDWHPNPLLPETKGEIAVPIKWQDTMLGVLDVQSDQAGALTEDDRLLLEGLCGQVAVAIEQTRLRQEMAERLEEVNRLYQSMSHEGWKTYRETTDLPTGFMFDQTGTKPMEGNVWTDEHFSNIPMKVLGGEAIGTIAVADDPKHPRSPEDYDFLQQVSDQVALALEGARLSAQTQTALAQSERLFEAGGRLAQAADLQELVGTVVSTLNIPKINRALMVSFTHGPTGDLDGLDVIANWWNGSGHEVTTVGTHYPLEVVRAMSMFLSPTPVFFSDAFNDERVDSTTMELVKRLNLRAVAALPLHSGTQQIGSLLLEAEEVHNFTQDETRLYSALAPQITTVLENRRQFERAQKQAERESTLNIISQKIQSATTVEAVLQIAARELGHALGAPMTVAQLSMKDKK